ncbi:hypothetical protein BDK51DRAFT_51926 [Blyttiomyces helicus]|uniref:Uncharacterized protein n=1 Tax=Blyttiomyces helicus TaxID=388810 RepID=A0A4P9W325_9FUNG|nr:hypothetical protein BDK51DRAFT_51926 [Blyttiomyces helicus]|eukprot:RKO85228.1 hypothetical protein BDK51DRAFT_51926 [Blyttiomyces helicus]
MTLYAHGGSVVAGEEVALANDSIIISLCDPALCITPFTPAEAPGVSTTEATTTTTPAQASVSAERPKPPGPGHSARSPDGPAARVLRARRGRRHDPDVAGGGRGRGGGREGPERRCADFAVAVWAGAVGGCFCAGSTSFGSGLRILTGIPFPHQQNTNSEYLLGEVRPWGAPARCLPRKGIGLYVARRSPQHPLRPTVPAGGLPPTRPPAGAPLRL